MTLTTERLREIAEDGFLEHGDAKLMARELLDNREAQPVVWVMSDDLVDEKIISTPAYPNRSEAEDRTIGELTPLYTAPPAPAVVKLPTEFYSDEGIVVRLEEVMAALAVVGVQYERKANAKTHCEFPSSEVPEEMTGGIAIIKHKIKPSNYVQWVKDCNACRAAMLAQPVSSGYTVPEGWKLVPIEPTAEMINAALASGALSIRTVYRVMLAAAPGGGNDS